MFFPLFLDLRAKRVLVVGGSEIALRKAGELLQAGAVVVVVAPQLRGTLPEGVTYEARAFFPDVLDDTCLVVAATDDGDVQAKVAQLASARRTFVIAADDLEHTTALSPAVVRRGPVTLAISSGGEAPALTRLLREIVEELLPEERYVTIARELRRKWKSEGKPMKSRFAELVEAFKRSDEA